MYATAIQIRRDAIKMSERYRAEKHLFFQIQGIKDLTIPQNEIAVSSIYPAKNKIRWVFSFFMDAFHFSTPLFSPAPIYSNRKIQNQSPCEPNAFSCTKPQISPMLQPSYSQIHLRTAIDTSSSRRSFVIVFGEISAALRNSALLIFCRSAASIVCCN